ncbi:MAG: hypothetical protein ACTSUI_03505, partial [Promethearchaeota archaeon]
YAVKEGNGEKIGDLKYSKVYSIFNKLIWKSYIFLNSVQKKGKNGINQNKKIFDIDILVF